MYASLLIFRSCIKKEQILDVLSGRRTRCFDRGDSLMKTLTKCACACVCVRVCVCAFVSVCVTP